jgi:uncharacterized protein YihD (DUF1040 family)
MLVEIGDAGDRRHGQGGCRKRRRGFTRARFDSRAAGIVSTRDCHGFESALRFRRRRCRRSCASGPVMRDAKRIPMILAALERRWSQEPNFRLGQLLVNVTRDLGCEADPLFELTDGELLRRLGAETDDERRYVRDEPAVCDARAAHLRLHGGERLHGHARVGGVRRSSPPSLAPCPPAAAQNSRISCRGVERSAA